MGKRTKSKQSEKGVLTKFQTDFLSMSEEEREKQYGYDTSQYYGRIVRSINQSFHDIEFGLIHLPKKYREQIQVELGLRGIQKTANRTEHSEAKSHLIVENTIDNLNATLKNLKDEHGAKIRDIAKSDFDKVRKWLETLQKYPK